MGSFDFVEDISKGFDTLARSANCQEGSHNRTIHCEGPSLKQSCHIRKLIDVCLS